MTIILDPIDGILPHGLRIEMKDEDGRTSVEQGWWLGELREQGYFCEVCHGWQSAVRTLEWTSRYDPGRN